MSKVEPIPDKEKEEINPNDTVSFVKQCLINVEKEIKKGKDIVNNLVMTKRMYNRILQKMSEK